ncbi:MAG: SIS domain-containing protein [Acidimicrobiales bacterium]
MTETTTASSALTIEEIHSQPAAWSRALSDTSLGLEHLPGPGEKVLLLGCGTSYYMGEAWASLRNAAGLGRTRAAVPSELSWVEPEEVVVVISRSGTTVDVERVAGGLRDRHRIVGIVGTAGTPIEALCHDRVLLDFADEQSVVQTRFATTTLVTLRRAIGDRTDHLVAEAEEALRAPLPLGAADHLVFLGAGWSAGIAQEAALKCREASATWTEAYPVREYQHGPIAAASERTLVWTLAPVADDLRDAVARTGARLVETTRDPLAELVLAHRVAVELATRAGRDADRPAHLSRSVVEG